MSKLERVDKIWILVGVLACGVVAVVMCMLLLGQHKTESGQTSGVERAESVICESTNMAYPYFIYDEASARSLKVAAIVGEGELKSVSLQYMLYYDDKDAVEKSEAENHTAMNLGFYERGLKSDAMDANYAVLSDGLRFGLYQTGDKLTEVEKGYFLLDGVQDYDVKTLSRHFEEMGMSCEATE